MISTFNKNFLEGKDGLRIIGDVHGNADAFGQYIKEARDKNFSILSLGDICDHGPDTPGAIRLLLNILDSGDGAFVPGNHCYRAARYFKGNAVVIQHGLEYTVQQMNAAPDVEILKARFIDAVNSAKLWHQHENYIFVHASLCQEMFSAFGVIEPFSLNDRAVLKKNYDLLKAAFYGETDGSYDATGRPIRTFNWIDHVPSGYTVFKGHDYLSNEIQRLEGKFGGIVYNLDTGSGKGGKLSYFDLKF